MLRRVRATSAALAFGSTVAAAVVFGTGCSVDRAGLSNVDAAASTGGTTLRGAGGTSPTGGVTGTGGLPVVGTGGNTGGNTGGTSGGTGGMTDQGTGGVQQGAGGADQGSGGMGNQGTGGASPGTGGMNQGTGGASPGTGGASPGTGGMRGRDCSAFPPGSSFTTPTDGMLHCYWVHPELVDWNTSESTCESQGGTLVTILSDDENQFVLQLASNANLFQSLPMVNPIAISLGATDGRASNNQSGAGTYAWVTGEPWGYTHWHQSQPDGSCNSCTIAGTCGCDHWLTMASDGTWYDRPEATGRSFVCEAVAR